MIFADKYKTVVHRTNCVDMEITMLLCTNYSWDVKLMTVFDLQNILEKLNIYRYDIMNVVPYLHHLDIM